jgi:hypothetical protein
MRDQNLREGGIEAQKEVQNQESLSPSSSSPAIRSVTENLSVTPTDVASGSVATDRHVQGLVEDFWRRHSKWINNIVQEVRFSLSSGISAVTHFLFMEQSGRRTQLTIEKRNLMNHAKSFVAIFRQRLKPFGWIYMSLP